MSKLTVVVVKGKEQYGAWIDTIPGIYAAGDTVKEVKADILTAIDLYKKNNSVVPKVIKEDFELEWNYDTASFLEYFSNIFTKAGLERLTGINQKQLGHYASGLKKPRKKQVEKLDHAIRSLVDDLNQIHLI